MIIQSKNYRECGWKEKVFKIVIYLFIFCGIGSKKIETAPESRPAAAWCGGYQGGKRRPAGRPEPLWRPTCDDRDSEPGPSSGVPEPSPPSPRTLRAIQAAMTDGSDKEDEDQTGKSGGASPRTLLAIQQALAEEEDDFMQRAVVTSESPANAQISVRHRAPPVVVSSSEEEPEPDSGKPSPLEDLNLDRNKANRSSRTKDGLSASSSEDEMDVVIAQRNRDLQLALLEPRQQRELKDESNTGHLSEDTRRGRMEGQRHEGEKVTRSAPVCAQPQDASPRSSEAPEKPDGNLEDSESDSGGPTVFKFIPKQHSKC